MSFDCCTRCFPVIAVMVDGRCERCGLGPEPLDLPDGIEAVGIQVVGIGEPEAFTVKGEP